MQDGRAGGLCTISAMRLHHLIVVFGFALSIAAGLFAAPGFAAAPKPPALHSGAEAWIVVDGASGSVMGSSHADQVVNPGDLVQLMTLFTALERISEAPERLDEPVTISAKDSLRPLSARRLYLVAGEKTPLKTLLNGVAVVAAEDAALAVATHLEGSIEAFVNAMNATAQTIGMTQSHFVSPIAAIGQKTTANDLAKLAVQFWRRHPKAFEWFSQREFSFTNHTQRNRNLMLWKDAGVNGMMESGNNTNLVSSWHRDPLNAEGSMPRDIFAVLLGGSNADLASNDMLALLRYGRLEFETIRLFEANTTIKKIDILTGNRDQLAVGSMEPIWVTVRRQDIVSRGTGGFSTSFEYMAPAIAPVAAGDPVGTLHVYFRNKPVADFTLVAMHDVGPGSFLSRFVDSVRLRMKPASQPLEQTAGKTDEKAPAQHADLPQQAPAINEEAEKEKDEQRASQSAGAAPQSTDPAADKDASAQTNDGDNAALKDKQN